jgi:spore maturation protein CgeB
MGYIPYDNQIKIIRSSAENIIVEKPYLKIACILDNFSYECLKYECNLIQLDTENWLKTLIYERPSLLLVESAWKGINGSWTEKICNLNSKNGFLLKNLIKLCKILKIPTAFWNKEDPCHFDEFIETAKLFDFIFTTDENCIQTYKEILQQDKVFVLPFAAQIRIHNPIEKDKEKLGKIAFAGTWYNTMHFDREKNMEFILRPALKYDLDIYDRNYNYNDSYNNPYKFPKIYQPFIKGYIPYTSITDIYKRYSIFLNVNSVDNSSSMLSRRVFELLACGTNVISSYSLAIEKFFPGIVKQSKTREDTLMHLESLIKDEDLRDQLSLLGEREIFNYHTYTLRLETILDKVGILYKKHYIPSVSIITYTDKENSINLIFENYKRQCYENKELIILLNDSMNLGAWQNKGKCYKNVSIFQLDMKTSLDEYLNYFIERSSSDYIAIFNANDYYGTNYLLDSLNAFKYTNADMVGKYSYYSYFEYSRLLLVIYPYNENKYMKFIATGSMIFKRALIDKVKFLDKSNAVLTTFLKNCIEKDISIYSIDRFNYIRIIHTSLKTSSTTLRDEELLMKVKIIEPPNDYINYVSV